MTTGPVIRVLLLALLVVAGCSSGTTGTSTAPADPLVLELSANEGSPQRVEAVQGQAIELTVTSDKPVEIHVHGFDVLGEADAGKPAVLEFTADRTGTFDVEAHPDTLLARLIVR
jgi:heme/copper-type cytochrome/quinol oxidase subunit 2